MTHAPQQQANPKDIIATWRWRINRLGYNFTSFAPLVGLYQVQLSGWCRGTNMPSLDNFYVVENKIAQLEAENGLQ